MPFTETVLIKAGAAHAGVTWTMQLLNADGSNNGASFAGNSTNSTVANLGGGDYSWHYTQFPDTGTLIRFTASDAYTFVDVVPAPVVATGGSSNTGTGDINVDHNYGGVDQLRVFEFDGTTPADNAEIRAYVSSDYDNGTVDPAPPITYTGSDGRWVNPLMLDADEYYLAVFYPETRRTKLFTVTVE